MRPGRTMAALGALGVLAVCGACATGPDAATAGAGASGASASAPRPRSTPPPLPDPVVGPVTPVTSYAGMTLPLDAYQPDPAEQRILRKGFQALAGSCLKGLGLELTVATDPENAPTAPPAADKPRHERRYGLLDPVEAAATGYVGNRSPGRPRPSGSAAGGAGAVSQELREAALAGTRATVNGRPVPKGGCAAEAERRLSDGAPSPRDPDMLAKAQARAAYWAERHPAVVKAFASWSGCMARHGYRFDNPWQPNDNPAMRDPAKKAQYVELAVADVGCKQETNLAGVWLAVETAYQKGIVTADRAELDKVRAQNGIQLAHARKAAPGNRSSLKKS
ncbi:hypothetical protein [Streptomyces sp. NPDC090025]|uniref:hypothetical protein n=1 Tax=Streptomyces sp. NPDC090025 TaxID=3365922 RepID=UPI00383803C4